MFIFNEYRLRNIIILELYYIIISIRFIFAGEFIDMKKLSSFNSYFVILDTGLYLYDFNSFDLALIYQFQNEYKDTNNKINLAELYYRYRAYIFCLVNEYLFIFNEYTYKVLNYQIKEIANFNDDDYYNIMPYKIENNNISFIIAFNNDIKKLYFYSYNFDINDGINEPNIKIFDDMDIQDKMIRCQINLNSTFIICFFYAEFNENKLCFAVFRVKDNELIERRLDGIVCEETFGRINQIKFAISFDNKFFVCILVNEYIPICFINEDNSYEFKDIGCLEGKKWSHNYKVFYFDETNEFILLSRHNLDLTILNNYNNSIMICNTRIFGTYHDKEYSLIYNNGYQVINYTNFTNYNQCFNISTLEKNKVFLNWVRFN